MNWGDGYSQGAGPLHSYTTEWQRQLLQAAAPAPTPRQGTQPAIAQNTPVAAATVGRRLGSPGERESLSAGRSQCHSWLACQCWQVFKLASV